MTISEGGGMEWNGMEEAIATTTVESHIVCVAIKQTSGVKTSKGLAMATAAKPKQGQSSAKNVTKICLVSTISALWVRLNVKREIGKFLPHPSFYPRPNISDRYLPKPPILSASKFFRYIFLKNEIIH